jgi:type I restriction enzyme, S subunit
MKFEPFENIFKDSTSHFTKVKKEDYKQNGIYPIVDQGQSFIGGYTDDENLIVKENLPVIIFGDHTKIFKYIDFPFTIGADGVKVLTLKNPEYSVLFYFFYLKSIEIIDKGYSRHFKYLKEKKLPVPNHISDQLYIANLLSKAETLINQRKESIRLLDQYLKSTFLEMFGDPVRNEKRWKVGKFKDLAIIDRKQVLPSEFTNDDFYIGLEDIEKETGNIIKKTIENAEDLKSSKFRFTPNHILYAKLRPYLNKVALPSQLGICSTDIFPILPVVGKSTRDFICFLMRSKPFVSEMHSKSSGANLPRASASIIENFKTYQPPFFLQTQFAQIVEKTEALKAQHQQSLQELEQLYGSLSQKAFRGELTIKENFLSQAAEPNIEYKKSEKF